MANIAVIADINAQFEKTRGRTRRERFYGNLLIACTGPGGLTLSVSDTGPLNRVFRDIAALVLPDPPDARGVKDIIKRDKDRRAARPQ